MCQGQHIFPVNIDSSVIGMCNFKTISRVPAVKYIIAYILISIILIVTTSLSTFQYVVISKYPDFLAKICVNH